MQKPLLTIALFALAACNSSTSASSTGQTEPRPAVEEKPKGPTVAEAQAFLTQVDKDLRNLVVAAAKADWEKSTNITDETEQKAAKANEELIGYMSKAIRDSVQFKDLAGLPAEDARKLELLRRGASLPAPDDAKKREELA